jgi:hypothetical protein
MLTPTSIGLLHQLRDLLTEISPADYARPLDVFNGSSLGGHTRHIIEFYECLLTGLSTGVVNYDERQRDKQVEHNRDYALEVIRQLVRKLTQSGIPGGNATLKAKFGEHTVSIATTFQREEAYLIEHSIHHFALLRIGVAVVSPQVCIHPHFGVAFSTLDYRQITTH